MTQSPLAPCWNCNAPPASGAMACSACGELLSVGDNYRITGRIGEGSMGIVYRATDEALARTVAIKVLHGKQASKPGRKERFLTECRAMAALEHPGIATIYAADAQQGQLYFVQRLVDGKPFGTIFEEHPNGAPLGVASHLAEKLLESLAHAHEKGITHRDVNPNNVLILIQRGIPEPVLIDFGMARVVGQEGTRAAWGGTPGYASPEQILDPKSNDPRSDLYAVGALFYAVLTGGQIAYRKALYPDIGNEPRALLKAYDDIAKGEVVLEPVSTKRDDIPEAVHQLIARALAPDPEARFQSATEMLEALRDGLETMTEPPETTTESSNDVGSLDDHLETSERQKRQGKERILSMVAMLTGLTMFVVGLLWSNQRADERRLQAAEQRKLAAASAKKRAERLALEQAAKVPLKPTPFLAPAGMALHGTKLFIADRGGHRIQVVEGNRVTTFAGTTEDGFLDGPSDKARFSGPQDIAIGGDGSLYIADLGNHRIRRIKDGKVDTVAGSFDAGHVNGETNKARFNKPAALAMGADGWLYVAELGNHTIRRIDLATNRVETFAGTGTAGTADGALKSAGISTPVSLAFGEDGKLFFTERSTQRLRVIDKNVVKTLATLVPESLPNAPEDESKRSEHPSRFTPSPFVTVRSNGDLLVSAPRHHTIFRYADGKLHPFAGDPMTPGFKDNHAAKARFRAPQGLAMTEGGTLYVTDKHENALRAVINGMVTTVVRGRQAGFADGAARESRFATPWGLDSSSRGLVVADWLNRRVRLVDQGVVRTVAGAGRKDDYDGAAMNANFSDPCDASWSSDGRIFIADAGNHRIRVLSTDGSTVRTFAGSKLKGFQDGAADQAQFAWPEGVATMDGGRVFIADTGNHSIRVIESQTVSTLAGKPTAGFKDGDAKTEASFHSPRAIDLAKNGAIFIADAGNHAIRRLFDGRVETIAGSGDAGFRDGELSEAKFEDPSGIEVGEDGSIYVADTGNQRIRRIHNGMVTTIAGIGAPGYRDGPASLAAFSSPADVEVHKGTLFVADAGNNVIRVIKDGKVGTFAGR